MTHKRYWMFAGDHQTPPGIFSFYGDFETAEGARRALPFEGQACDLIDWAHIYDTKLKKVIHTGSNNKGWETANITLRAIKDDRSYKHSY